jgi:pentatricopeptide repeat protein
MVDLLGRAGHVTEAKDLIDEMSMKPTAEIWGALT